MIDIKNKIIEAIIKFNNTEQKIQKETSNELKEFNMDFLCNWEEQ